MGGGGNEGATIVTGATGYLGGLAAATLLVRGSGPLVLPHRARHSGVEVVARVAALLETEGRTATAADLARLVPVELPGPAEIGARLLPAARAALRARGHAGEVAEIVHCAACLDYFDDAALEAANVDLTRALVDAARAAGIARFVYLSTAFSSGYTAGLVREAIPPEPAADPTSYTRTKRAAERIVAAGGVPWLILRPSVVIGGSRDGRYDGKAYGLYQLWAGAERLLAGRPVPALHIVANGTRLEVVPQDAFQNAFFAARRDLPAGSIVNIVSRPETLPTVREVFELWLREVTRPAAVRFYARRADVPLAGLEPAVRTFLEFGAVNLEIAGRSWRFETAGLDRLRAGGLDFADATIETIARCQRRFVARSPRLCAHAERFNAVPIGGAA